MRRSAPHPRSKKTPRGGRMIARMICHGVIDPSVSLGVWGSSWMRKHTLQISEAVNAIVGSLVRLVRELCCGSG